MKRRLYFLFAICLACLLVISQSCKREENNPTPPAGTESARTATGKFEIAGKQIFDPNGNEFIPIGANINTWAEKPSNTDKDVQFIKQIWKLNIVRVSLHFNAGQYYGHLYPTDEFLDSYVNAFTTDSYGKRVVVMFEAHDFSGSYYTDSTSPTLTDLANFWKRVAQRYSNNPYVWFNVMNEPGYDRTVSSQWLTTHETVIKAVREAGSQHIIVCDGNIFGIEKFSANDNWTREGSAILTYGPGLIDKYSNLLFSFHIYCPWNNSQSQMESYVDAIQNAGLALIAGEYGIRGGENCDNSNSISYFMNVLRPRNVGRLAWHYVGWDGNNIVNGNGRSGTDISVTDGTKPPVNSGDGSLTTLGSILWDDAHSTPSSTGALANGIYKLVAKVGTSGSPLRVLDLADGVDADNRNVRIWNDNGSPAQRWYIESTGDGFYKIVSQAGSKTRLLSANNGGRGDNSNVNIWAAAASSGAGNQRWKIEKMPDNYYKLTTKASYAESIKYCLDVDGANGSSGTNVQIYRDNSNDAQRWRLDKF